MLESLVHCKEKHSRVCEREERGRFWKEREVNEEGLKEWWEIRNYFDKKKKVIGKK